VLSNCRSFFRDALHYRLWDEETERELRLLAEVRHVSAHQAGRLDKKRRKKLKSLLEGERVRAGVCDDGLVPTASYVVEALSLVKRSIIDLAEQVMPGEKAWRLVQDDGASG
jgi:hypothetical protein